MRRLSEKANELEAAHQWTAAEQALRTALKLLGAPDDVWNARAATEDDAWQGNAWWRADADYKTVVAAASCYHNLGQLLSDTVRRRRRRGTRAPLARHTKRRWRRRRRRARRRRAPSSR